MTSISYSDFEKIDIRIGTVKAAEVPAWSHWVMKLTVDFGSEIGERTIFAGIMKFYEPDTIVGKQLPFVVNIEPKKIGPKEEDGTQNFSQGMMLAAISPAASGNPEEEKPVLFSLLEPVPNGSKVR